MTGDQTKPHSGPRSRAPPRCFLLPFQYGPGLPFVRVGIARDAVRDQSHDAAAVVSIRNEYKVGWRPWFLLRRGAGFENWNYDDKINMYGVHTYYSSPTT